MEIVLPKIGHLEMAHHFMEELHHRSNFFTSWKPLQHLWGDSGSNDWPQQRTVPIRNPSHLGDFGHVMKYVFQHCHRDRRH